MDNRFERHLLIHGWQQSRLSNAKVIIMGMGALGNEAARILAMSGVKTLTICDPDIVQTSNLNRCILFREKDVGKLKVDVAALALKDLAGMIHVDPRPLPLVHGVGLAELRDASLVLGCLDSRSSRLQLSGRCALVKAPYIDGGTHPWGGEIRLYLTPDGPCYGCGLTKNERAVSDVPWSCFDAQRELLTGSTASSSALVGAWLALIAIRFLMDLPLPKDTIGIDASQGTTRIIRQKRDFECCLHHTIVSTKKLSIGSNTTMAKFREVVGQEKTPIAWEAIQNRVECQKCHFQDAKWGIPEMLSCPMCSFRLRSRTTLELDKAPSPMRLTELGIAPREILALKTDTGIEWIELSH